MVYFAQIKIESLVQNNESRPSGRRRRYVNLEVASLVISAISLLLGIISFIITIMTWKNTKDIAKRVDAEKIKKIYAQEHPHYIETLNYATCSLKEGERRYFIVSNLLGTCRDIQKHYDNWNTQDKKSLDKFTKGLDEIPEDNIIDEITRIKLIKELYEINAIIKRVGELNDI